VLQGFGGASVLEVAERFDGNAYHAVYTVHLQNAIYVLHAFQKKSRSGIATTANDIKMIQHRVREEEILDAAWSACQQQRGERDS
jgi:phage-related protein